MAPSLNSAIYETLSPRQIRVLVVAQGEINEPLQGHLEVVSLDSEPEYNAISYMWGDPIFSHEIVLSGIPQQITASLYGALCRFRDRSRSVRLWADALCINQSHIMEKNSQVAMMADVYRKAHEVLVWLGPAGELDALANRTLSYVADICQRQNKNSNLVQDLEELYQNPSRVLSLDPAVTPQQLAETLLSALDKPYFSRLWPLQEILLARKAFFHTGDFCMPAELWIQAMATLLRMNIPLERDRPLPSVLNSHPQLRRASNRFFDTYSMISKTEDSQMGSLVEFIRISAHLQCSDPRDRIYAIRALANIETIEKLRPDYDLDLFVLHQRCALAILAADGAPSNEHINSPCCPSILLALAGAQEQLSTIEQRPSWVPNFERLSHDSLRKIQLYSDEGWKEDNRAGGSNAFTCTWCSQEPHNLNVTGHRIDSISQTAALATRPPEPQPDLDLIAHCQEAVLPWLSACIEFWSAEATSEEGWRIASLFVQGNRIEGQQDINVEEQLVKASEEYLTRELDGGEISSELLDLWTDAVKWLVGLYGADLQGAPSVDYSRVLSRLSSGFYAWVPQYSRDGDDICLLQGAPAPFVMRPQLEDDYVVVGDAWAREFADGEAWDAACKKQSCQHFRLV